MVGRTRRASRNVGKKAVYMTPYKNLALEMMKMYERKGEMVELKREMDSSGTQMYVVYIFPRD